MKRTTALLGAVGLTLLTFAIIAGSAGAQTITEEAGSAGTVTFSVEDGVLAFIGAAPAEGWDFEVIREDGRHLKVVFRSVDGTETEFEAEFEDGQVQVETSEDLPGGTTSTTTFDGNTTSTTLEGDTTSTTLDDDDTTSTTLDDDSEDDSAEGEEIRSRVDGFVGSIVVEVGPAGAVTISGDGEGISLDGLIVTGGWGHEIERVDDGHIEINFLGPDGTEVEFEAQFMGDHLDWKVEIEGPDDDDDDDDDDHDDDDDDDDHDDDDDDDDDS